MKNFMMMLLLTSFLGTLAHANVQLDLGQKNEPICPALLEETTRSVKSLADIQIKAPSQTGTTEQ